MDPAKSFSSELTSLLHLPSCLSEKSAAVTTKQTNHLTTILPVSSFSLTVTYSCNGIPVFLCQSVILQESRDEQTPCQGKPEWYIPADFTHWLTWGLRAWYSPSKEGRLGISRPQQRIISSKREGGQSGGA